jgi:hypothetical protein
MAAADPGAGNGVTCHEQFGMMRHIRLMFALTDDATENQSFSILPFEIDTYASPRRAVDHTIQKLINLC